MHTRAGLGVGAPEVPEEFWQHEAMVAAFASRHMGKVVSAYRRHPFHGRRALPQELLGEWLGMKQSKVSRLETGPPEERLDQLVHCARVLRVPDRCLWFTLPETATPDSGRAGESGLGAASASRSRAVVTALEQDLLAPPTYVPPVAAVDRMRAFVRSSSRVFVLTGAPGSGKSRLTLHAVDELGDVADCQLHSVSAWDTAQVELAAEVLRYASVSNAEDPLIVLEGMAAELERPCLVVVDGIDSQAQFDGIGRTLELLLRQVACDRLKFVLVVRTPPEVEFSAFPLLAASTFRSAVRGERVSFELRAWGLPEARMAWDECRGSGDPMFSELPRVVQELATLPLYMRLLRATPDASPVTATNAYRLVERCVRALVGVPGPQAEREMARLADLAVRAERSRPLRDLAAVPPQPSGSSSGSSSLLAGEVFRHDVIREFFVAQQLADVVQAKGRSAAAVAAFNDLAVRASLSASARGVFEFVVSCLDGRDPDLLAYVALSPTVGVTTTLPLMMRVASTGCAFATDDVWQACTRKSLFRGALSLCRQLLASSGLASVLGEGYSAWLLEVLREHGAAVWADVAAAVEQTVDAETAQRLLAGADLRHSSEAVFFARHVSLFVGEWSDDSRFVDALVGHDDWRVRAALADRQDGPPSPVVGRVIERLSRDPDYKVRAASTKAVAGATSVEARACMGRLILDDNWHVRSEMLRHLSARRCSSASLMHAAIDAVTSEPSWRNAPENVAVLKEQLLLLAGEAERSDSRARQRALFTLLREVRTGWLDLPDNLPDLIGEGRESPSWLVQREAAAVAGAPAREGRARQEWYRRLRGQRGVQVALDVADLDRAVVVAQAAAAAGAELVEVGDPLIKEAGIGAVERIKREAPAVAVVAEMMSADWGRDQVVLAAEAGADVAFLIGPASAASVAAAVAAGHRLGLPIALDVHPAHLTPEWVREMERAGVDGFAVTTNIDLGVAGDQPFARARRLREWTRLPVAVSGGFSPTDPTPFAAPDWDVLVVGRSVAEAVDPPGVLRGLIARAHRSARDVES